MIEKIVDRSSASEMTRTLGLAALKAGAFDYVAKPIQLQQLRGLVQQALLACGLPGPRRSDAQARLGRAASSSDLQRGDIVVWLAPNDDHDWTGHSALMLDGERIIHATGGKGVVIESLAEVEARLIAEGFATAVFRRL